MCGGRVCVMCGVCVYNQDDPQQMVTSNYKHCWWKDSKVASY